ncbi:MAG: 1-acyl-sn-glycerol-3-phosphate acyltransferase [Chitinophagales bacterium]|jgi:1-acyl-sn-glycerol-3-phosphate acyltransferase|nr:1-acyl-sn-glycerol-3-phosphate acyltransferase [Chitinophagales bacterium]
MMFEWFLKRYYRWRGWTLGDTLPEDLKKCVIIVAPHTSAWDFIYGAGAKLLLSLDAIFLAKKELFRWPLKQMLTKLGGVAVDRSKHGGMVFTMVQYFNTHEYAAIVVPAEGTRKRVTKWRTGFYHAAVGAGVPIVMGYIDYRSKKAGLGPSFMPSGDLEKDWIIIRNFYKDIGPFHSDKFSLPE